MAEFVPGPGVAEAMRERGDYATAPSSFFHPKGSPGPTLETGQGAKGLYLADNFDGTWRVIFEPHAPPPTPAPTKILRAIDVSSYQSRQLADYIRISQAEHVIVRMYMRGIESPPVQHSIDQVASTRANSCTPGAYGWLYRAVPDARMQVQLQVETATLAGITIPVMWQDVEPYGSDRSLPTLQQIDDALDECADIGVLGGIYTNQDTWNRLGRPEWGGVPLWLAHWDGIPEFNIAPLGKTVLAAKQTGETAPNGQPLDMNIIYGKYTT